MFVVPAPTAGTRVSLTSWLDNKCVRAHFSVAVRVTTTVTAVHIQSCVLKALSLCHVGLARRVNEQL